MSTKKPRRRSKQYHYSTIMQVRVLVHEDAKAKLNGHVVDPALVLREHFTKLGVGTRMRLGKGQTVLTTGEHYPTATVIVESPRIAERDTKAKLTKRLARVLSDLDEDELRTILRSTGK